ncbi:hypothetical protein HPB51_018287 [Rhipicephalus microplus]|uniref:Cuticle protein n=1 Tax=Rhipicephalus microplus TaxID=6941 RepID=A0A9J6D6C5_RHIMP|nr:hypothetical protein HPB51_018287 [Rhipicephalus microplus]
MILAAYFKGSTAQLTQLAGRSAVAVTVSFRKTPSLLPSFVVASRRPDVSSSGQQGQCLAGIGSRPVPQPYQFGYEISDGHGNKQVRYEVSDGHNRKQGSYGFVDAHGVYRQVQYVADHNGFRATIDTNEPGVAAGYSAGAVFKLATEDLGLWFHRRPIPPPPHRVPVVLQNALPNRLAQKPIGVAAVFHGAVPAAPAGVPVGVAAPGGDPALQALQVVQGLHGKAITALPVSSVQYAPGLEHSGGVDFIPSAPRLTAASTDGSSLIDPRRSHVTYVETPAEHPFASLRTHPPVLHEGGPGAHKQR